MSTEQNNGSHALQENAQQYFSAVPATDDVRKTIHVNLRGTDFDMQVSRGVFSTDRLDPGTAVLLKSVPAPLDEVSTGSFLDLGCGWGPITLALAHAAPQARVWAVDVNERAIDLTEHNALSHGFTNVIAGTASSLAEEYPQWNKGFDLIWSNPPIRIGKDALHELLMEYLPRLNDDGYAYLVVQKHLGADSLIAWLDDTLNAPETQSVPSTFEVSKYSSSKGYRVIEVHRIIGKN